MPSDDVVILAKFTFGHEAELARVCLESEGIPCILLDTQQAAHAGMGGLFPIRLQVFADDQDDARAILIAQGLLHE